MSQLKEILAKEKLREDDTQCRTIHLFLEGSFYRAYNWSAWLCVRYISEFKPTRRKLKDQEETFVFVGFPAQSLLKFVPDGTTPVVNEDKSVDIQIPVSVLPQIGEIEPFLTDYANWQQSVPLAESKSKEKVQTMEILDLESNSMRDVLRKIIAFPVEQKTPIESMLFLTEVRRQISALL